MRRGKGEGAVFRRRDGRWVAAVDCGWQGGRRRRKYLYAATRREAYERLAQALRHRTMAADLSADRLTLERFLARWLDEKRGTVRPRTWASYETTLRLHVLPFLGRLRLAQLGPPQLSAWLRERQTAGVSARTLRYARVVLRAALQQAIRWRLITINPAALVDPPRYRPREIQPLTPDQCRQLLAAAASHRLGALVTVLVGLGLRLGEALGLHWEDVTLDVGTVTVRHTLERSGGDAAARRALLAERHGLVTAWQAAPARSAARRQIATHLARVREALRAARTTLRLAEPKSARSRRTIALPRVVAAALQAHRRRQLEERLAAGPLWRETGFVFTTPRGTPLDPRNVHRWFKRLLIAAGLPSSVRLHDLRHSSATMLLAQGVDLRTIMATLGHSQVSVTADLYAHVLPALQRQAAAKVDEILGG